MLPRLMLGSAALLAGLLLAACDDDDSDRNGRPSAGAPGESGAPGVEAGAGGTGGDGGAGGEILPCLDRPTDLPRPPVGRLPCELLPPGFSSR